MEELETLAIGYINAKAEADVANEKSERLKKQLKETFASMGLEEYTVGNKRVYIQQKPIVKFDAALLGYLKQNGYETYVKESIDDSGLKKALVKSELLAIEIGPYIKATTSEALCVEELK